MENHIVLKLRNVARHKPLSTKVKALLKGTTIRKVCAVSRLKYWGHIVRRPANHILKRALNYAIYGKFKVGRPSRTWHDSLHDDLTKAGATGWQHVINDRKAYNDVCDSIYLEPRGLAGYRFGLTVLSFIVWMDYLVVF